MSDDEVVPMTMLDEPGEPAGPGERTPWTSVVVALSSAVGAIALAVIASAELDQARSADQQRCLQEAQLQIFAPFRSGQSQDDRLRDALASCGLAVPTEQ